MTSPCTVPTDDPPHPTGERRSLSAVPSQRHPTGGLHPWWGAKSLCRRETGYTLVEILAVAGIIMFAGIFLLRLGNSITGRDQFATTDNRLTVIEAKIRQYYLAHERLPENAANEIPVAIDQLDLEQKYRLDGWGNYFQYTSGDVTNIEDVDGRAASVVSGGPDQNIATANDNIKMYVDLSMEAEEITRRKLSLLMEKVATYDALFAGIDNNRNTPSIDENPLDSATTLANTGCPPVSGFTNDPASGLPTLDSIEEAMDGVGGNAYSCAAGTLVYHMAVYYHLRTGFPGGYDFDPWQNPLKWGYLNRTLDGGSTLSDTMDPRYHKFFSSGPDPGSLDDDIIP
jgi:type II secretory pathway pseudopilin PulG